MQVPLVCSHVAHVDRRERRIKNKALKEGVLMVVGRTAAWVFDPLGWSLLACCLFVCCMFVLLSVSPCPCKVVLQVSLLTGGTVKVVLVFTKRPATIQPNIVLEVAAVVNECWVVRVLLESS